MTQTTCWEKCLKIFFSFGILGSHPARCFFSTAYEWRHKTSGFHITRLRLWIACLSCLGHSRKPWDDRQEFAIQETAHPVSPPSLFGRKHFSITLSIQRRFNRNIAFGRWQKKSKRFWWIKHKAQEVVGLIRRKCEACQAWTSWIKGLSRVTWAKAAALCSQRGPFSRRWPPAGVMHCGQQPPSHRCGG